MTPNPGPWTYEVSYDGALIRGLNQVIIAYVAVKPNAPLKDTHANGRLLAAAPALRDALRECIVWIERGGDFSGYGFFRPENPHDFSPDHESCSAEEIANHKAACEAWDRGDYQRERGSEWLKSDDGKTVMRILRAPWGIGSYSAMDPDAAKLLAMIRALLAELDKP